MNAKLIVSAMASADHLLLGNLPIKESNPEQPDGKRLPVPTPEEYRRKNTPGAFAKHNGRNAERACRRQGRDLRALVAFRGRHGLRFASRERVAEILRSIQERRLA